MDRGALGIPDEKTYVDQYRRRMGLEAIPNWAFYLAFSFFRLGAIAQGVAKRAHDGNASNKEAMKAGTMVEPLARFALDTIEKEA